MPPIESFMGVDWTAARRHFFNVSEFQNIYKRWLKKCCDCLKGVNTVSIKIYLRRDTTLILDTIFRGYRETTLGLATIFKVMRDTLCDWLLFLEFRKIRHCDWSSDHGPREWTGSHSSVSGQWQSSGYWWDENNSILSSQGAP